MPTSVAYVTEEHFVLVKGALTRLTLSILGGGVAMGDGGGLYGLLCMVCYAVGPFFAFFLVY